MYILGISSGLKLGHHDGAAVLIKNGKVIFAAEEERFILSKHARSELPKRTILYILKKFKLSIKDISYVCSPLKTYPNYKKRLEKYFKFNFGYSPRLFYLIIIIVMPLAHIFQVVLKMLLFYVPIILVIVRLEVFFLEKKIILKD